MTPNHARPAGSIDDDPAFGAPFLDIDEWRDAPVPHHYVHGGFEGTETRFSIYLPPKDAYRGRLVQELPGGLAGVEPTGPLPVDFFVKEAFRLGAAVVSSNQGWQSSPARPGFGGPGLPADPAILSHRASAQTARFTKALVEERFGARPHHAYLIGGSGGGARSVACMEHVPGLWDGAVPMVMVNQHLCWHLWSVWHRAAAVLASKKAEIVDAVDPGGSGDPFSVLDTDEQREVLADLYAAGYPMGGEWLLDGDAAGWAVWITHTDPDYLEDFWNLPGYAGTELRRVQVAAIVERLVTVSDPEGPALLAEVPKMAHAWFPADAVVGAHLRGVEVTDDLIGCWFAVGAPGEEALRLVTAVAGDCIGFASLIAAQPGSLVPKIGQEIVLDDTITKSWPYYHRHVIDAQRPTMRRWASNGTPIWPQRPIAAEIRSMIGALPTGCFDGKMILVQTAKDHLCPPTFAHDYIELVRRNDPDADRRTRLWIIDNAIHGDPVPGFGDAGRFVPFFGAALRALADLVAWVEDGVEPPASTGYELDPWNQTVLAPTASLRAGVQPVIEIEAPPETKVGAPVRIRGTVEVPPGAGSIVQASWDLDGSGGFDTAAEIAEPATKVDLELERVFDDAGFHVVMLRAASHRDGDATDPRWFVHNVARVRVRVTA